MSKPSKRKTRQSVIQFADQFFPARPRELLKKAQKRTLKQLGKVVKIGPASSRNKQYVNWLINISMLQNAETLAKQYSGSARMWRNPYARPRPRSAIKQASVWYTAYPISMITRKKESIIQSLANPELWEMFSEIGIEGLHTGPMKIAGGIDGWKETPSIDGHFDRISNKLDPMFGTKADFNRLTEVAARYGAIIIDDIVPGHTGKGPDFWLAAMAYGTYPGIYHMVEIRPEDWHLLPTVPKGENSSNLSQLQEEQLKNNGYIVGRLQRVIFYEPGVKETNWSATKVIRGVDGVKRRWVYLHYFKEGQPSINWLDPTFSGMRLVVGDALHSLGQLGSRGLRLDANGFLGVEKVSEDRPAWSEGHPLSEAANHFIASMVRKVGGFTFQELNLTYDDIKVMSSSGADLSYDFINRPAYHHALVTGDTEFLRMTLLSVHDYGIDPASLVHALQNHDDLTYELVHYWTKHKDDLFSFRSKTVSGGELRQIIRQEMADGLVHNDIAYNMLFTQNGIACTTVSAIAAVLGIPDLSSISDEDKEKIIKIHILLAQFNAWQPGVFALSGWDLSGACTLPPQKIEHLLKDGDTRWINRGAYDLMGLAPHEQESSSGMPKAYSLYGTLPEQLSVPGSFANQLKKVLAVRKRYNIAVSHQVDIPVSLHKSIVTMVHKLQNESLQVTILNFSQNQVVEKVASEKFTNGHIVFDMATEKVVGKVAHDYSFEITLDSYSGKSLLIKQPDI